MNMIENTRNVLNVWMMNVETLWMEIGPQQ